MAKPLQAMPLVLGNATIALVTILAILIVFVVLAGSVLLLAKSDKGNRNEIQCAQTASLLQQYPEGEIVV